MKQDAELVSLVAGISLGYFLRDLGGQRLTRTDPADVQGELLALATAYVAGVRRMLYAEGAQ